MDHDLSRLQRAWTKSPDDSGIARALDSALLRAGRRERVEERLRAKFLCPAKWVFSLDRDRSYCFECKKDLACAPSVESAVDTLREGRSVVVARDDVSLLLERLVGDTTLHTGQDETTPCAATAGVSPIDGALARRLLKKAATGSLQAPLLLSEIAVGLADPSDDWRASSGEDALSALRLPAPPPLRGERPHRAREEYRNLHARGVRVDEGELLHDALLHCQGAWSIEEYVRLDRSITDDRNYNSLDVVAAMILLVVAGAELPVQV